MAISEKVSIVRELCVRQADKLAGCDFITVAALNFVETTEFEVRGTRLFMNGEINSKTLDQFEEVIAATLERRRARWREPD